MKDKKKARCCSDKGPENKEELAKWFNNYTQYLSYKPLLPIEQRLLETAKMATKLMKIKDEEAIRLIEVERSTNAGRI